MPGGYILTLVRLCQRESWKRDRKPAFQQPLNRGLSLNLPFLSLSYVWGWASAKKKLIKESWAPLTQFQDWRDGANILTLLTDHQSNASLYLTSYLHRTKLAVMDWVFIGLLPVSIHEKIESLTGIRPINSRKRGPKTQEIIDTAVRDELSFHKILSAFVLQNYIWLVIALIFLSCSLWTGR